MPQSPNDIRNQLTVFQTVELSDLITEDIQLVPEGVWLELKPLGHTQLCLSLYKSAAGYSQAGSELPLKLCSEHNLSLGQTFILPPSQLFQLCSTNAEGQRNSQEPKGLVGSAVFSTIPNLYFNKKFNRSNGLGQPHSEVAYFKAYYSRLHPEFGQRDLQVIDLGCGRGRNAVVFAADQQQSYKVLGLDQSRESLVAWNGMSQAEGFDQNGKLISEQVDLNTWRKAPVHDIAMAIVSLQFLEAQAAVELLCHCMERGRRGAFHLAVFPIASQHSSIVWPGGFHFLPQPGEIKQLYEQQGWSMLEYRESYGHLGKVAADGLPVRGVFATLIAQKK